MFTKILIASDGSEGAHRAAQAGAEIARRFNAPVTVLHVFSPPPVLASYGAGIPAEMVSGAVDPALIEQWAQSAGQAVAERTEDALRDAGVSYTFRQEIGHPADRIVRVAEHEKCDLIVIGSRGLSGVKEFLLGSVSSRVSHHAPCAVLIVH